MQSKSMARWRARVCTAAALVLAGLPWLVAAHNNNTTTPVPASTFWHEGTQTQFSLNIANDSDDVFIYFSSPTYSWVGFGFGQKMEHSLMFIMYPNDKANNLTLSPRLGARSSEPTFTPAISLEILPGTSMNGSIFTLAARCSNCRVWTNGYLNVTTHAQPLIYAYGPSSNLHSSSRSASLKRHLYYGTFTMDMLAATGPGGVPAQTSVQSGVAMAPQSTTRDHDGKKMAHAALGCAALFVLWPVKLLVAGFLKNEKTHWAAGGGFLVCLGISYLLGGLTSGEYNHSKTYKSLHQVLAFLSLLPLTLTFLLAIPSVAARTAKLPSLPTHLATFTLLVLFITGALGLHLSQENSSVILVYSAVALLILALCVSLSICLRRRHRRIQRERLGSRDSSVEGSEMMLKPIGEHRQGSMGSPTLTPVPLAYQGYGGAQQQQQQKQQRSTGIHGVVAGGVMPGPTYLLNMHPGVPVPANRM